MKNRIFNHNAYCMYIFFVLMILFYGGVSQINLPTYGCTTTLNTDNRSYQLTPMTQWNQVPIEKAFVQDAPVGNVVFRTSAYSICLLSPIIQVNLTGRYTYTGYIRRTSVDSIDAGKIYISARPFDAKKNLILPLNLYVWGSEAKTYLPYKQWIYIQFQVGSGTPFPLPAGTTQLAFQIQLNTVLPTAKATYEINGVQVTQLAPNNKLKTSQIQCPFNRLFELNILTGFDKGSSSNALNLKLSFYDSNSNLLAVMPVRWGTCNYFQSGNIDTVKACANWVQKVASMKVSVSLSDELQVESMTVAFGSKIATKSQFWLDDTGQGTNIDGWPVYTELFFKMSIPSSSS